MMHNEWELLVAAEDIEPGDTIIVEDVDDGKSELMIFVQRKKSGVVVLRDKEDELVYFNANNLEETKGYRVIVGKSEEEISI